MIDSISLYNAVCKINNKLNEIIDRLNKFDPGSTVDIVNSINGKTGNVTLTGNDVDYSSGKTVNAKIDDNSQSIANVKQDIANLTLENVLGESSAQIQIMTQTAFNAVTVQEWNNFYNNGFRIVGIVDSANSKIQKIYLQNTSDPHTPIPLAEASVSGVTDINGLTGSVTLTGTNIPVSENDATKIDAKIESMQNSITAADENATQAMNDAADADSKATQALTNAANADTKATKALTDAANADTKATKALTNAVYCRDLYAPFNAEDESYHFSNLLTDSEKKHLIVAIPINWTGTYAIKGYASNSTYYYCKVVPFDADHYPDHLYIRAIFNGK